jgi:Lrp/AsnC family leucine-responsive transcriptional regulator
MTAILDSKDVQILRIIQENCRLTSREIADKIDSPVTTVFAKIRRFEKLGLVSGYHAVLKANELGAGTTAFIFVSFAHKGDRALSHRKVAKEIARFPEVQEAHIVSGEWDFLIKVKVRDVDAVGKFVVDELRLLRGIEKTQTCFVFETEKESTAIPL